jgi:hypothetical protein
MDLSARDCPVWVIKADLACLLQQQVRHERPRILRLSEPCNAGLQIVVESTFLWSWFVDGLQEAGYHVCLAHTLGPSMLTGATVNTDRRDASPDRPRSQRLAPASLVGAASPSVTAVKLRARSTTGSLRRSTSAKAQNPSLKGQGAHIVS